MSDPIKIWFQTNISPVVAKIKDDLNSLIHQSKKLDDQLPVDPPINPKDIEKAESGFRKLDAPLERVSNRVGKIRDRCRSLSSAMAKATITNGWNALKLSIMGVVGAIGAAVATSVKAGIDVARVWTMAGGGLGTYNKLLKDSRKYAAEYALSHEDVSKAMYNALSAGVSKQDLDTVMNVSAKISVADGSDISTVIDGVTTVLNAFKIEAGSAEKVTDLLFQTVALGKTTFGELAANIATVAPVAAATNIPLKEILAHVATLTASGTPTAEAMTQIRASITGLNKALGDGWSKNMSYQEGLRKVWEMAGQSQTELIKLVGSTEAVQAVLGGVGKNAKSADNKLKDMAKSAGKTEEAFQKVDQFREWPKAISAAKEALGTMGDKIKMHTAPYVQLVADKLNSIREDDSLWDKFGQFLDSKIKQIQALYNYLKNGGDIGDVVEAAATILKGHIKNGTQAAIQLLAKAMPTLGDAFAGAAKAAFINPIANNMSAASLAEDQMKAEGHKSKFHDWERYQELYKEKQSQIKQWDLEEAGASAADQFSGNGWGDADIAEGNASLDSILNANKMQSDAFNQLSESVKESATAQTKSVTQTAETMTKINESTNQNMLKVQETGKTVNTAMQTTIAVLNAQSGQVNQLISIANQSLSAARVSASEISQLQQKVDSLQRQIKHLR